MLAGETAPGDALRPGRPGMPRRVSFAAGVDHAYSHLASAGQGVDLVVVDADAYGARLVSDLRAVFPRVRA